MNLISEFHHVYWREPLWLLLFFQPFIFILLKKIVERNNLLLFADKNLQPWVVFPKYHAFKNILLSKNTIYLSAWLLFSIAVAGPRTPLTQIDKKHYFGVNIMLVADLSRSMKATDISPNRLRRAKIEIFELLEKAKDHRIGLTVFSARPHLFIPLTSDHDAFKIYLESLEKLDFPTLGSDPVAAIEFAQKELIKTKGKSVIIMLTDGDFPAVTPAQLDKLKRANIPLYILGIGTVEGEAVQLKDGSWLKYNQQPVVSRMNENNLRKLSSQLKGIYSSVYDDDLDWQTIYQNNIARLGSVKNIHDEQRILWRELFPYFLIPSLILFLISLSPYQFKIVTKFILLTSFSLSLVITPGKDANAIEFGQTAEQSAYRAYKKGTYSQAEKLYQKMTGYPSYQGQGNSLYKMGHYNEAIQQFVVAALNARNNSERANSLYNLANSYFRTGNFTMAISTYQDVLRYQPDNKACLQNMKTSEVLKKNIEARIKAKEKIISSSRSGSGPRSASVAEGTEIGENTSVSTGDSTNKLDNDIPLPKIPNLSEDAVKKLLLSGLNNISFADVDSRKSSNNNFQQTENENINLLKAQQQANALDDTQYLLWKRLFEIEEGFPAPVKKPHLLPDLKPW